MTNPTPSASGPKSPRRELLEEAADLIDGDRNITYGSPTENFANIAELWNTRFAHLLQDGAKFTGSDVADAMILVKVARNITDIKRDNYADIAGYAGCGYECWEASRRTNHETLKTHTHQINYHLNLGDSNPFQVAEAINASWNNHGLGRA